jgi:hypothetical protein
MGFFSKLTDDILGLDPSGGGVYGAARDVLGDRLADDVLGMDPSGGGSIGAYNVALPLIAGYYGAQALGAFGGGGPELLGEAGGYGAGAAGAAGAGAGAAGAAGAGAGAGATGAGASLFSGSLTDSLKTLAPYAQIGSSVLQGSAANKAAQGAANAANAGVQSQIDLQRRMYEEGVARQQPFYQAGVNALPGYLSGIGQNGELVRGFTQADYQADPGYAFRLSEGQKQLDRQAAIRGGQISGSALKAASRFGQDMASQEYSNAYNRFRDTQTLRRNALAGVTGFAPTAAGAMATSGQNYANTAGNAMATQGVNTGNALIAGQQARQSMYGDIGSTLGKYLGSGTGYGGAQAAFSQTGVGGSGFGSGMAYGNQDLGRYF